jgi:dolichol-phosphate mannosyltransferase
MALNLQDTIDREIQDKNIQSYPVACATILIPALNEVGNIDLLMERILSATKTHGFRIEILIVDRGSKDGTQDKVIQWSKKASVRLVKSDGKGELFGDILLGASMAETDIVVVMEADLGYPPEALPSLIQPVLDGTHDMAIGSRHLPGGQIPDWPWSRRIVSKTATLLAWPLVSISDPMSGFFAVRRERLLSLGKEATGFKVALEIAAKGDDSIRIAEVPITFIDRKQGTSYLRKIEIFTCLKQMLSLAGGSVSSGSSLRFAAVGSMGFLLDYLIFNLLLGLRVGIVPSQMVSFFAATIFNFFLNRNWAFNQTARLNKQSPWKLYTSFLIVCVLSLYLRGAVLALLMEAAGWSPRIAIFFAIAAAALSNFVGTAFFVFPQPMARTTPSIRWRVFCICVVLYSLILRLAFMGVINLLPEEAYYWNYAQHIDLGYLDHPPMVGWLIWLGTHFLGNHEIGVRFPGLICWLISSFFMYRLGKNLSGKTAAFITLMFFAALPVYFGIGFIISPDAPLYATWAGSLYFLERVLVGKQAKAWFGVGICLGLGMLSKFTIALLLPAIGLYMLLDKESRSWFFRPEPYWALGSAFLLFSPVLIWDAGNDWVSLAFQGTRRWSGPIKVSFHHLLASMAVLLTPVGIMGLIGTLAPQWLQTCLSQKEKRHDRQWLFSLLFAFIPFFVFLFYSLREEPKLNWTGPVWLAILPVLAYSTFPGTGNQLTNRFARFSVKLWRPTIVILLLFFGGGLYYLYNGLPALPPVKTMSLPVAWREMGEAVETVAHQIEKETGEIPVIVGMDPYFISSELSFYLKDGIRAGRISGPHLFGMKSVMWKYWVPAAAVTGRSILLIDFQLDPLSAKKLEESFERLDPPDYRLIKKDDRAVGKFYYRMGYGYHVH